VRISLVSRDEPSRVIYVWFLNDNLFLNNAHALVNVHFLSFKIGCCCCRCCSYCFVNRTKYKKYTGTESALPKARAFSLSLSLSLFTSFSASRQRRNKKILLCISLFLSWRDYVAVEDFQTSLVTGAVRRFLRVLVHVIHRPQFVSVLWRSVLVLAQVAV